MKRMLKWKKFIVHLLVTVVILNCMGSFGVGRSLSTVNAASEDSVTCFLEGYGAGEAFRATSWKITTGYIKKADGTDDIDPKYLDSKYFAAIEDNEHSGNNEKVIRLINGIQHYDSLAEEDIGSDKRSGLALLNSTVKLDDASDFSAKFTFSMPDACCKIPYTRGAGGDGIVFLITSKGDVTGVSGGGIGYKDIKDSIGIEFDSFYNTGNGTGYSEPEPDVNSKLGIDKTDSDKTVFYDHVAVVLDGENTTGEQHLATTFLYNDGFTTSFTNMGNYDEEIALGQTLSHQVSGQDIDKRLFTSWVEYDGTNGILYVRYALGDFETATRPATAQITIDINSDTKYDGLKARFESFKNADVKVGFTSAIGSSKANHTIHSVAFTNEYLADGIKVPYIEKYYVETPNATSDYIIVNGKKYVLDKEHMVGTGTTGDPVTITPLDAEYSQYYTPVDPTIPAAEGYPNSATITSDSKTVVCQFFDRIPHTDSWQYTANGNVIIWECTSTIGICDKKQEMADKKIVLTAPDMIYNGNQYNLASYTDNLTAITGGTVGQIYYEGVGSTQYTYSTTPPTQIGTYCAIVEIDGVRAVKEFRILPVPLVQSQPSMEKDESPKTGDTDNSFPWLMLMLGSGLALLMTGKVLFKKED